MLSTENSGIPRKHFVSIYLNYADPDKSDTWHTCAQFALVASNPIDPTVYIVHRASPRSLLGLDSFLDGLFADAYHRFTPEEPNWAFTQFAKVQSLYHVRDGHSRPLAENGRTEVTAFVRVIRDPTGLLWHNSKT
jgi:ubiquitin carboxyl-terminal hydrolase 7